MSKPDVTSAPLLFGKDFRLRPGMTASVMTPYGPISSRAPATPPSPTGQFQTPYGTVGVKGGAAGANPFNPSVPYTAGTPASPAVPAQKQQIPEFLGGTDDTFQPGSGGIIADTTNSQGNPQDDPQSPSQSPPMDLSATQRWQAGASERYQARKEARAAQYSKYTSDQDRVMYRKERTIRPGDANIPGYGTPAAPPAGMGTSSANGYGGGKPFKFVNSNSNWEPW